MGWKVYSNVLQEMIRARKRELIESVPHGMDGLIQNETVRAELAALQTALGVPASLEVEFAEIREQILAEMREEENDE